MCLIIHKPAGAEVPFDLLENAADDNPDGIGLMYTDAAGVPCAYKILPGQWADPVAHVSKVLSGYKDTEVGIHFRWRTHGAIDEVNTHPYDVPGMGLLMHNGVLPVPAAAPSHLSDTYHFIQRELAGAPALDDEPFWQTVGEVIRPTGSKFLVLDNAGRFKRINEPAWKAYKGLMLSNTHSIPEMSNYWRKGSYSYGADTSPYTSGSLWETDTDGWARDPANPARSRKTAAGLLTDMRGNIKAGPVKRIAHAKPAPTMAPDLSAPLPNKLTRREAKVLRDCLRAGHWGPFARIGGR
jgi:hypothetical protein